MTNLFSVFEPTDPDSLLSFGYSPDIVALSIVLAVVGGMLTLFMIESAQSLKAPRLALLARAVAGLTFGAAVWGMHFTSMLAFNLSTEVTYDSVITGLSIIPVMFAGWIAAKWFSSHHERLLHLIGAGTIIGAGIGAMHYTGMLAMQMTAELRLSPFGFALSVVVAVVMATLSLCCFHWLSRTSHRWPRIILGGVILGLAVSSMHYTAMWAARFSGHPQAETPFPVAHLHQDLTIVILSYLFLMTLALIGHAVIRIRATLNQVAVRELQLAKVVEEASTAIILLDDELRITHVNAEFERTFGLAHGQVLLKLVQDVLPDWDSFMNNPEIFTETGIEAHVGLNANTDVYVRLKVSKIKVDEVELYVGFITDISSYKEREVQLTRLAQYDGLTGLLNRAFFDQQLGHEIAIARNTHFPLSVLMLDIDHFKRVNDTYGHLNGDRVLKDLAMLLMRETRKMDFAVRFGGEELVLILPETPADGAKRVAEKLRMQIEQMMIRLDSDEEIQITASFGIGTLRPDDTAETLMRRVDACLYQAKEQGRNRCRADDGWG